MLLLLI